MSQTQKSEVQQTQQKKNYRKPYNRNPSNAASVQVTKKRKRYKKRSETPNQGPHPLENNWTFWYTKVPRSKKNYSYTGAITNIGSFSTVEGFWSYYSYLKRPNELKSGSTYYMFKDDVVPMWENFQNGGIWTLRMKSNSPITSRVWEELLFACVGETFEEPDIVGISVSIRANQNKLQVWHSNEELQYAIQEKIKRVLLLETNTPMMYKNMKAQITERISKSNAQDEDQDEKEE